NATFSTSEIKKMILARMRIISLALAEQANHFPAEACAKLRAQSDQSNSSVDERRLDVSLNRRTLAGMKVQFATLLGLASAIAFVANNASAHPGHSPTDVAAQLAAPAAGADHLTMFGVVSLIVVLVVTRVALRIIERRNRMRPVRNR
ncbi:MAG TPA: hypothetical protein VK530_04720, partial [Candidatus Acidoferrum sp.]|nr:hypothetical protein [Candidatus Acidoferrum sp.]